MKTLLILFAFALGFVAPGPAPASAAAEAKIVKYQCPMHPQIIRDEPGSCPICHMDLEAVELEAEHDHAHEAASSDPHGGHAAATPAPSKGPQAKPKEGEHVHGAGAPSSSQKASFTLPENRQQLIGVKVQKAQAISLNKTIRLAARMSGGAHVAQLLELDAGQVKAGLKATLVGPQGQKSAAKVAAVDSALDTLTRTFAVSLYASGREPWMREGVFCEAVIEVPLGRKVAIPLEAVLELGESRVVFVRETPTRFAPREVTLGERGEGYVQVTQGVKEGEDVVTSANFLIDSEARFKAALKQF